MPEDLASKLVYRDADILVLDKPPGVSVHRAPGAGRNLEVDLPSLSFGLKWTPGLAHRLDRDTSGCLVLGRHPEALRRLNRLFAEGGVRKIYWAVVAGVPDGMEGLVDRPLLKVHRGNHWSIVPDPAGQSAVTHWRLLGTDGARSWLELRPETGRTHQIRVHCAVLGCPVVGDRNYGGVPSPGERLHLHARAVGFTYGKNRRVEAEAAPPPHMLAALAACGYPPDGSQMAD